MTTTSRSWKRLGLQFGILAGGGLALVGGIEPSRAAPVCAQEGQCTIVKPLLLIALDYSTAMNAMVDADTTRWDQAVAMVTAVVDSDNGYIQGNVLLGLLRFGHDPDVDQSGTTIVGDASGLVDGHKLDVAFYDALDPNNSYFHCNGQAVKAALEATPPPLDGAPTGIGAWTAGAIAQAGSLFAAAAADHPDEVGPSARQQMLLVITQGVWSDAENTQVLQPPAADPSPVALDMWNNTAVPTYVVAVGDAQGTVEANKLAEAGGTGQALVDPDDLILGLKLKVQEIINDIEPAVCQPAMPRIMFLVDASSSMLNVMGDSVHGAMGETRWDLLRGEHGIDQALTKTVPTLFDGMVPAESWAMVGTAVYGDDDPAEHKLVVDYAPCRAGVLEWAFDPQNSCLAPGCVDPWGGPPITWTFQTKEYMNPPPATVVTSHVPRCDDDPLKPGACTGSGAFVHLGLELVKDNLAAYKASCQNSPFTCGAQTKFYNVLIADGAHDSDDAAVEAALTQMFGDGTRTYVVGLGELAEAAEAVEQLTNMAAWGSGGALDFFAADSQVELQAALAQIFAHMFEEVFAETMIDPCCGWMTCVGLSGDVTEPDPLPLPETESDSGSSTTQGETTTGEPSTSTTGTTDGPGTSTTAGPSTSGESTTGVPTTGAPTSEGQPGSSGPGGASEGSSGTDTDGGAPGAMAEDGCACATGASGEGLFASLVSLGLAGLGRRRRRVA